jgi:hypothetical protein
MTMLTNALTRARSSIEGYPRDFWVLFWGLLINMAGTSLV